MIVMSSLLQHANALCKLLQVDAWEALGPSPSPACLAPVKQVGSAEASGLRAMYGLKIDILLTLLTFAQHCIHLCMYLGHTGRM